MAGQGFDPDFIFSLPTGRMAVMEGESAIKAVYGAKSQDPDLAEEVGRMRDDYEHQLDAKFAGARGFFDTIVVPGEIRETLGLALQCAGNYRGPHLGAFVMPPLDYTG